MRLEIASRCSLCRRFSRWMCSNQLPMSAAFRVSPLRASPSRYIRLEMASRCSLCRPFSRRQCWSQRLKSAAFKSSVRTSRCFWYTSELRSCTRALFAASKLRSRVEADSGLDQRSTLLLAAEGVAGEHDAAVAAQLFVLPHAGEHAEHCGVLSTRRRKLRLRIGDNISPMTRVARAGIGKQFGDFHFVKRCRTLHASRKNAAAQFNSVYSLLRLQLHDAVSAQNLQPERWAHVPPPKRQCPVPITGIRVIKYQLQNLSDVGCGTRPYWAGKDLLSTRQNNRHSFNLWQRTMPCNGNRQRVQMLQKRIFYAVCQSSSTAVLALFKSRLAKSLWLHKQIIYQHAPCHAPCILAARRVTDGPSCKN